MTVGTRNDEAGTDLRRDPVQLPGGIAAFVGHLPRGNQAVARQPGDDVIDPRQCRRPVDLVLDNLDDVDVLDLAKHG